MEAGKSMTAVWDPGELKVQMKCESISAGEFHLAEGGLSFCSIQVFN